MAAKKPFRFTGTSYIINKSGDGSVRCRQETLFEQIPSPKGTYQYKVIKTTVFMPEDEQLACDIKMMKHASDVMSDYCSHHPESALWD